MEKNGLNNLKRNEMNQKFMYVATWDGIPILGAPNRELLEQALDEYNNDKPIRYEAYNPKYPDDLEGWYYYKDPQTEGEEIRFSVRCIEFKPKLEKDACIEFGDWLLTKEISYVDNTDEGNVYMVESNIDRRIMTMKEIYEFYLKDQG